MWRTVFSVAFSTGFQPTFLTVYKINEIKNKRKTSEKLNERIRIGHVAQREKNGLVVLFFDSSSNMLRTDKEGAL